MCTRLRTWDARRCPVVRAHEVRSGLMHRLGLRGIVHVWGLSGAGKTVFASRLAAEASSHSCVHWFCTDLKTSVVTHLRRNVCVLGGVASNITVEVTRSPDEARRAVLTLCSAPPADLGLVVVDPVTRVLDMSFQDDIMWGRELFEEVLPTLAAMSRTRRVPVILTSECRYLGAEGTVPVCYAAIRRWADHDLLLRRGPAGDPASEVVEVGGRGLLGRMWVRADGAVEFESGGRGPEAGGRPSPDRGPTAGAVVSAAATGRPGTSAMGVSRCSEDSCSV